MPGTGQEYTLDPPIYQNAVLRQASMSYEMPGSPSDLLQPKLEVWQPEPENIGSVMTSENNTDVAADEYTGKSKLKGAFWPGMSVFDSATQDQKRKRNQRKDESVLRLMEQTAAEVEPTEAVWSEHGELQRIRDIYATPSLEGSPV